MVRLEFEFSVLETDSLIFQFLNGAIRMYISQPEGTFVLSFQFLNGAIRIKILQQYQSKQLNFNS